MRILLTGASGFIGRALAQALERRGHEVVRVSRHPSEQGRVVQADFAEVPSRQWWQPRLAGLDAVVNAVGILRESPGQRFEALHTEAPRELFHACAQAGIPRVVQISALGADAGARSRYHLSKKAADDVLRGLPLRAAIVQPSVVYGPGGSSTALFNRMAVSPLLPLPGGGTMSMQPVHVDDVVDGIVALLETPVPQTRTLHFAGERALSMKDYLAELRRSLGLRTRLRVLPIPAWFFRLAARAAGVLPGTMLDGETADMLLRGNAAEDNALPQLLGRPARGVPMFVRNHESQGFFMQAVLALWLPLLRGAIALLWLWTGVVSLGLYPVQESYALLERVGLRGATASFALYGAAALDIALGLLTLLAPARWRARVWGAQLLLIAGYTLLITLFLPEYWLHPYGPISKNLPLMAAIALLWGLEARDADGRR